MFSSGNITNDYFFAFLGQKQRMKKFQICLAKIMG